MSDRHGDWQLTASGRVFWPLDPDPADIDIGDIAHHLGRICRWGGSTRWHYSVAEHSVMLARWFRDRGESLNARCALMHDAPEAYLGDVVRPLKALMADHGAIERRLEVLIWRKYGLPDDLPDAVKAADTAILGDERDQLFDTRVHAERKRPGESGLGLKLESWDARTATVRFLGEFNLLFPGVLT